MLRQNRKGFFRNIKMELTPVERRGNIFVKRDDKYEIGESRGGKARTCWHLSQGAVGLVTAGSRSSPQINLVAQMAKLLKIPCRAHCPTGQLTPELIMAKEAGAEIVQHRPGHNSVIIKRARDDANERGWKNIHFGMECEEAITQTRKQVKNLPTDAKRLVIAVGSGMSLSGVLWGMQDIGLNIPVLGIVVGANPEKRLKKYAPPLVFLENKLTLANAGVDYGFHIKDNVYEGLIVDSVYEAKCLRFLQDGDVFWVVGIRTTEAT